MQDNSMKFKSVLQEANTIQIQGKIFIEFAKKKDYYHVVIKMDKVAQSFNKTPEKTYGYKSVNSMIQDLKDGFSKSTSKKLFNEVEFDKFRSDLIELANNTKNKNKSLTYNKDVSLKGEKNSDWDAVAFIVINSEHFNFSIKAGRKNVYAINPDEKEVKDKEVFTRKFDSRIWGDNSYSYKNRIPKEFTRTKKLN